MSMNIKSSKTFFCQICRTMNRDQEIFTERVFLKNTSEVQVYFCYKHSVEFFTLGQFRFFKKYNSRAIAYSPEMDENILEYLEEIERT